MKQELYTTGQAAKKVGISRQTLQAWIAAKKIKAPEVIKNARVRLWTETDITKLKAAKQKIQRVFGQRTRNSSKYPLGEASK